MSQFHRAPSGSQIRARSGGYGVRMNPRRPALRPAQSGITLLETLAVMTIVAILLGIGVPSFKYVTSANRVAAEVNGLLGDMQFARTEAIKEGQTVGICASTNSTSATPVCAPTTQWQSGWIIYADLNGDGILDNNEPVLRAQAPFTGTDTFAASGGVTSVSFNREGFATNLPAAVVTLTLHLSGTYTSAIAVYTRCLAISTIGTLATQTPGTGNCT